MNESDNELLHTYLDGEMPVSECEGLWRRLAAEPQLTTELERLRSEQVSRQMVWSSLEPDERAVARLEFEVLRAAKHEDMYSTAWRSLRLGTAVAACLFIGFAVGRFGRVNYMVVPTGQVSTNTNQTAGPAPAVATAGGLGGTQTGRYIVNVRDGAGNVIASQRFDSKEEAQQFADALEQAQANRQQSSDTNVVPAVGRF